MSFSFVCLTEFGLCISCLCSSMVNVFWRPRCYWVWLLWEDHDQWLDHDEEISFHHDLYLQAIGRSIYEYEDFFFVTMSSSHDEDLRIEIQNSWGVALVG